MVEASGGRLGPNTVLPYKSGSQDSFTLLASGGFGNSLGHQSEKGEEIL
jgi:hypothetical protein